MIFQEKQRIAAAIYNTPREEIPLGRGNFPVMTWPGERPCLSTFVGSASWLLFDLLGINGKPEWLLIPSEYWDQFQDYRNMKIFVMNLPCVNDGAERAMAMMKKYIDKVKNEKDKQDLIQLIQGFRQKVTDYSKDSLKNI